MHCLIVGADNLGTFPCLIETVCPGAKVTHWDGRTKKSPPFPSDVTMVIVLTGFIRHQIMHHAKREAKKRGLRIVYLKRGKSEIVDLKEYLKIEMDGVFGELSL